MRAYPQCSITKYQVPNIHGNAAVFKYFYFFSGIYSIAHPISRQRSPKFKAGQKRCMPKQFTE